MDERNDGPGTPPADADAGGPGADTGPAGADAGAPGADAGARTRQWLDQLQAMIDGVAKEAAPVVKQVGLKAAELAAVAGEKAGPIAYRAAEMTESAGRSIAERSRQLADELRGDAGPTGATGEAAPDEIVEPDAGAAPRDEEDGA
jgi:hypothetical protein